MHNAALRVAGLPAWRYQLLPVPPELFDETVRALPGAGFRGVNVTIPHKQPALALAATATDRAREIGAANTLVFGDEQGELRADNTDAPALVDALPFSPAGRSALVLGAGGTARAAVWALRSAGATRVEVFNRTPTRARALCADLGAAPAERVVDADLLVNCTSIGLRPGHDLLKELGLDADLIRGYGCVVDYVYGERETRLVQMARQCSVPVVDGLELLVGQGALSFAQFTGLEAPRSAMRAAVHGR